MGDTEEMIRVLIVDDEIAVCRLIEYLVPWEQLEMTSVGYANNGPEAYRQIREKQPDIVLTDIRMPGFDGLELIEKIREEEKTTAENGEEGVLFVLISGYREFEFAKQAIRFGVEEYLLKPIQKEELIKVLEQAGEKIRRRQDQGEEEKAKSQTMRSLQENLRKSWILELTENLLAAVPMSREEVNRKYCFEFQDGSYCGMVIRSSHSDAAEKIDAVTEILDAYCYEYEWIQREREIRLLLNCGEERSGELWKRMTLLAGPGMRIARSRERKAMDDCAAAMREAKRAMNMRWWKKDVFFLSAENFVGLLSEEAPVLNHERREQFLRQIETMDAAKTASWCSDFLEETAARGDAFRARMPLTMQELETAVQEVITEITKEDPESRRARTGWQDASDWQEAKFLFRKEMESWVGLASESRQVQKNFPIRAAAAYIQEHFTEKITLEQTAEQVHLSPVYFSGLFKKETCMNFSEYLTQVRVQEAKRLLKQGTVNVSEVAERVGYSDARHFSKTFQRLVGITPKEYRKLHS